MLSLVDSVLTSVNSMFTGVSMGSRLEIIVTRARVVTIDLGPKEPHSAGLHLQLHISEMVFQHGAHLKKKHDIGAIFTNYNVGPPS